MNPELTAPELVTQLRALAEFGFAMTPRERRVCKEAAAFIERVQRAARDETQEPYRGEML